MDDVCPASRKGDMRADGRCSELSSVVMLICRVRSGNTSGCIAVLCASTFGSLFWIACCTSAPRSCGAVLGEPEPLTFVSLVIVMFRGVCVSILSNFGDAPADVSCRNASLAVESRGFMCGSNGLLVCEDIVVDLDDVVTRLTGASTDCEPRSGLAIAISARRNIRLK